VSDRDAGKGFHLYCGSYTFVDKGISDRKYLQERIDSWATVQVTQQNILKSLTF